MGAPVEGLRRRATDGGGLGTSLEDGCPVALMQNRTSPFDSRHLEERFCCIRAGGNAVGGALTLHRAQSAHERTRIRVLAPAWPSDPGDVGRPG